LQQLTGGTPYVSYTYSYPHKTAYRPLAPRRALKEVWSAENKDALYLYLHVPFCEMRCGFCNLFTMSHPQEELTEAYLAALERQARRVRHAIGDARYARMAIGGGTPTWLSAAQLDRVFRLAEELFGIEGKNVPISVETSPRTAEMDKLRALRDHAVERISIGVQSLVEAEVNASGRAQKSAWVETAIGRIRQLKFPTLNLDLIYGLPGQTVASWLISVQRALAWQPEELYLYPLYVRPLTGLARWGMQAEDSLRLECYRAARDLLISAGYQQVSMRMFSRQSIGMNARGAGATSAPVYCCQEDGMLGLGCGARSYSRALHYSSEYAVGASGVRGIIASYVSRPDESFEWADYGCNLNQEEQRRRWVIKSLLRSDGLRISDYRQRFRTCLHNDLSELQVLEREGLTEAGDDILRPTPAGLERSDVIGPWLFSPTMRERMDSYELR
jgi:oxygen-independent coproporphyrinogen-3 oxidase